MTGVEIAAVSTMAVIAVLTFLLGRRPALSASTQLGVARRTVRATRNAAAMSGEYLCVAMLVGVAGAVLTDGADALWYPIGFTAGFLLLMVFVAAPLRRSGAYTIPDFVQGRLESCGLRRLAAVVVVLIALLYLVPQLHGAQLVFRTLLGTEDWVGPAVLTGVVLVTALGGGMRSVTVTQAVQYWLKLFAVTVPTFVLCGLLVGLGHDDGGFGADDAPTVAEQTTVTVDSAVTVAVSEPVTARVSGVVDGADVDGALPWAAGDEVDIGAGTDVTLPAGATTPVVTDAAADNAAWRQPGDGNTWQLLGTYSLLMALLLGTMGLPHILMRFYTNPDGKAARHTARHVLALVGVFAAFPVVLGVLSRIYVPQQLLTGDTDAAVLLLPEAVIGGVAGQILATVLVAGVFSAFLAAAYGLVLGVAGVVATDLLPERVRYYRVGAVLLGSAALGLSLAPTDIDLATGVALAFALAASTFCPVLILGIWWRGLTAKGAAAGMLGGGGLVIAAIAATVVSEHTGDWAPSLLQRPALVSVPVAFTLMVVVSNATKDSRPADVTSAMLRMHAPDTLGFVPDPEPPAADRPAAAGRHRR